MTTDSPSLTDLRQALATARIAHKKAILRADVPGVTATIAYLNRLENDYEAALDRELPAASQHEDNTYDPGDLGNGFHVLPRVLATPRHG